jgi:bacillithiol biosynthesis cysteine-adding enzyme BshC
MPTDTLSFRETGYFSNLICDYIEGKEELKPLFHRFSTLESFKDQIKEKSEHFSAEKRGVLTTVLQQQYQNIPASAQTRKNIELLKSSNTFTITTGHQLNLFTGPLYFLYKIISVVNLCKTLKRESSEYNFVPIFWMATEDHDFEEISFFNFKGKKVKWEKETSGAVGHLDTSGLGEVAAVLSSELGKSTNANRLIDLFEGAYLKHTNLAEATRYLANELFGDLGLVIIDADNPLLKRQFIPEVTAELSEQVTYQNVSSTNQSLEELGYGVQVNPRKINLFYLSDGLRERIIIEGDKYRINNTDRQFSHKALIQDLENHPERYSPNVLMRPLYQEVVLPNLCYIGGGGEMAYWLQLKDSFKAQKVPFPILLLRDSVLIRTEKQLKKQKKLGISDTDLFLNKNAFINKYVRRISNINIDFNPQIHFLEEQFAALYELADQTDPSFLGAVKAQEVKQIKGLKHLEKRLLKAQKRVLADRIERSLSLKEQFFPNGSLQERQLNFSELYLEFGDDLITVLAGQLNPLDMRFLLLTI